jgi:hypothetical protein
LLSALTFNLLPFDPYLINKLENFVDSYDLRRDVMLQVHDQPLYLVQEALNLVFHFL